MPLMTPSEAMVETLRTEGVTQVPGIVGSAFMDALDLFPAAGIRFVPVRHEQSAAHMADAMGRVSGKVEVCIGQNGPGITNMVTSVAAAYHAHTPMIVITPAATTGSVGLDGFQEIEQMSIFRTVTKFQIEVPRPDRMAETFRTAFREAYARRGPVQVNIPRDYFYGESDAVILEPHQYRATGRIRPEAEAVEAAAALLENARFPVVLAGSGVTSVDGHAQVARLAEKLGAPVATTYLHNDAFPANHDLAVGPIGYMGSRAAMNLLSDADVVLAIGSRLNVFGKVPQYGKDFFPKDATIVQVDINPGEIGRSTPVALGIVADAAETAAALADRVREADDATKADRRARLAAERDAWKQERTSLSSSDATPISPRRALDALATALPDDAIVTTDIGNICSTANGYLEFTRPRAFLPALGFGNCGYAYPAALGAKLAAPDRPVVAIIGDGAWGMSVHETMTAVEEGLGVVAVVFNNQQWGAEKRNQIDFYDDRYVGVDIGHDKGGFDFAAIAEAMGAVGRRIEDPAQLTSAFSDALAGDRPVVLEVMVDPKELAEPFRRDALQPPKRYLDRYKHLNA
jgi:sulfoacetaldehyde acetyltransferase